MFRYNGVEIEDTFAETYYLNETVHSVLSSIPFFVLIFKTHHHPTENQSNQSLVPRLSGRATFSMKVVRTDRAGKTFEKQDSSRMDSGQVNKVPSRLIRKVVRSIKRKKRNQMVRCSLIVHSNKEKKGTYSNR